MALLLSPAAQVLADPHAVAPVASAATQPTPLPPQVACDTLARTDVSQSVGAVTGITSATVTTTSAGYQVCDVKGVIAPQIQFQVQLPTTTYRQRYLQTGCGGLCGSLNIRVQAAAGCVPVTDGTFAMASNNQGHVSGGSADGNFGYDPQLRVDFAYRADHVTALAAKALIKKFYGASPKFSYFDGCSQGGHEGLTEAQRYPDDFDGILAGAPASITTELNTFNQPWLARVAFDSSGKLILPASKLPALHKAVMNRCDGLDGLVDGQLDDPRACNFDPATIACPASADTPECLTKAQITVVRKIYSGAVTDRDERLYPGGQAYGSELAWAGWLIPNNPAAAQDTTTAWGIGNGWVKNLAFEKNPPLSYNLKDIRFDRKTFAESQRLAKLYDAKDPDLNDFRRGGGKLIMWHGWADQAIPPTGTIWYYKALQNKMGGLANTQKFARLFMFPGVYHCGGGYGPNTFDLLTSLIDWVEKGSAPTSVTASVGSRTRPVFAYPQVARYKGSGSIDDAANFVGAPPQRPTHDDLHWLGG
ncbi:tannase/feruloyl esterase family alpha/beta hydrolase [Actinomadura sp. HBU206391]|nr:tannase/feruloyl esterase family alpha/beta hydrolase [Actinomadura sp. HBU206391]